MTKYPFKICFKCGKNKPLHDFYCHSEMLDGHLNKCKECTKKDVHWNYLRNRDHYAEYERKRFQDPKRKEYAIKNQRKRRQKNPEQYKAMGIVHRGKRTGKVKPENCAICNNPNTEAHHEDYSKPLNITWLCRKHHLSIHGKVAYEPTPQTQDPA